MSKGRFTKHTLRAGLVRHSKDLSSVVRSLLVSIRFGAGFGKEAEPGAHHFFYTMKKTIIAIDPGASGALAYITPFSKGVPTIHKSSKSDPLDALKDAMLAGYETEIEVWVENCAFYSAFGPNKKQNVSAMGKLQRNLGEWIGLSRGLGLKLRFVAPKAWQVGLSGVDKQKGQDRKRVLKIAASRVFPGITVTYDNCDALLILDYAIRQNAGGANE